MSSKVIDTLYELQKAVEGLEDKPLWMERNRSLVDTAELRCSVEIAECGEDLVEIPQALFPRFSPHAYVYAGAPYEKYSPFMLRSGVLEQLELAQKYLTEKFPGYKLKIFDAYRPNNVQQYMVDKTFEQIAREEGLNPKELPQKDQVRIYDQVFKLFARPSVNPQTPPPHSTGAAIDLTIINTEGEPLDMGGEIDSMPPQALPNHYADKTDADSIAIHSNREILKDVMQRAGFCRLWFEWWHFSYGDQFWALDRMLRTGEDKVAVYGGI